MKLFDTFEAVKFVQEDMIFITQDEYLYYIYDPKYKKWRKHQNAGNDMITVSNYPDVSREELVNVMQGRLPEKETDFMRLCYPSQLCIRDMLELLEEDYTHYMSDYTIYHTIHLFLLESDERSKSFEAIRNLLDAAILNKYSNSQVVVQIKDISYKIIGWDIFKREIAIFDGYKGSSYFHIEPVKIIDYSDTNDYDNVSKIRNAIIAIEEDDIAQYLTPFLYKYFDNDLEANKQRIEYCYTDDDGNRDKEYVSDFEWNLTDNYFTFDSMAQILKDITDTVDALISGRETEYTKEIKVKRGFTSYQLLYAKDLSEEEIAEYNANIPKENDTAVELVVDFYQRFIYRIEHMMKVGKEKGYDLISFKGP